MPSTSIVGVDRLDPVGVHVDGAGAVGDGRDQLEADPHAAGAGEGDRVPSEVERLLDVAGEQDRHVQIDQRGVAGAGQRRGLGLRIVADDGDDATTVRRPGEDGVANGVAGAVEPRRLAVPDADNAVVALVAERVDELTAHHRGGGELLVDTGTDDDRQVGHGGRSGRRFLLERPDRRALIAGDERRRVQAEAPVDAQLVGRQAGDGLHPGEEDAALLEAEAIRELVRGEVGSLDEVGHGPVVPSPVR